MKTYLVLFSVVCSLALTGCCTTHHADRWEYQTLVVHAESDDALNAMLKDGWKVAGYSVDNGSQYFLLKRHKHKE